MENTDNPGPKSTKTNTPGGSNPVNAGGIGSNFEQDFSFRCGDVVNGCDWQTSGRNEDEIRRNVEQHGREHHGMKDIGEETWSKVKGFIRRKAA
jgi:predicted small metal-binding protein